MKILGLPSNFGSRMCIACIAMCFVVSCATRPSKQVLLTSPSDAPCRTKNAEATDRDPHYVVVDDHGRLAYGDGQIDRIRAELDKFKINHETGDPEGKNRNILVFVHGGLNPQKKAIDLADMVSPEMEREGFFPLFLIWRTGPIETYWEQSAYVRDGWRYEEFRADTPLYWITDIGQALVRAPLIYLRQLSRVTTRAIASPGDGWALKDEKDHYEGGAVTAKNNLIFARETVDTPHRDPTDDINYFLTFPFRALASPPIDGLGKTAWENMVRRARTTVHQTAEFDPDCFVGNSLGVGGFSMIFRALSEWLRDNDPTHEFRITLIGHSMGAIVLNELIRTYADIEYDDIVYMGAAASIRDLSRVIVPYLRIHPSSRFYNLMLHPRNEAWELTGGGAVPSGSLLEWIDEMYEPPQTMLDRTLGKWRNVRLAKDTLDLKSQEHMVFKVFGGNVDKPRKHGDFNDADTCFWNPWFWVDDNFDWADWNSISVNNGTNQKNRDRRISRSDFQHWEPPKDPGSLRLCQEKMRGK